MPRSVPDGQTPDKWSDTNVVAETEAARHVCVSVRTQYSLRVNTTVVRVAPPKAVGERAGFSFDKLIEGN